MPASEAAAFRDSTKHIVVLALENRSFDHVLGFLHKRGDNLANIQVRLPPGADTEAAKTKYPPFFGLDFPREYVDGAPVPPENPTPTPTAPGYLASPFYACPDDEGKMWSASMPESVPLADVDTQSTWPIANPGERHQHATFQLYDRPLEDQANIDWTATPNMDGAVHSYAKHILEKEYEGTTGKDIMQSIALEYLPVFKALANEYAVSDTWHCAVPSQTYTNRLFLHGMVACAGLHLMVLTRSIRSRRESRSCQQW